PRRTPPRSSDRASPSNHRRTAGARRSGRPTPCGAPGRAARSRIPATARRGRPASSRAGPPPSLRASMPGGAEAELEVVGAATLEVAPPERPEGAYREVAADTHVVSQARHQTQAGLRGRERHATRGSADRERRDADAALEEEPGR